MVVRQYRVVNAGSGEPLTGWLDSLGHANSEADECEKHESQPECRVESREISETQYETERIENAYRAAGLTVGRCGIVVLPHLAGGGRFLVADDQYNETYETADAAIADAENWKAAERLSEFF